MYSFYPLLSLSFSVSFLYSLLTGSHSSSQVTSAPRGWGNRFLSSQLCWHCYPWFPEM